MAGSLRLQLLAFTLAPLACLAGLNAVLARRDALASADLVLDGRLVGSARTIAEATRDEDGLLQASVPPAALEMFDTGAGDFVYYRVTDGSDRLIAGASDLPVPPGAAARDPQAYEARFRGRPLRLVALDHSLAGGGPRSAVTVAIGSTLGGRDAMVRRLWLFGFGQQVALLVAAAVFITFGLRRGLAPLLRLSAAVQERPPTSLDPVEPEAVQAEIRPLVEALNRQVARVRAQLAAQHRFVVNAAHQLRTPLTVLTLQATAASRRDGAAAEAALDALRAGVGAMSRLVEQLLTLSRAEPGARRPRRDRIVLGALAREVLDDAAERALGALVDLGLDERTRGVAVLGDATMLGEALSNLVDNALRYCPEGSRITVSVDRLREEALLSVEDDGPGVPAGEEERIFERFYRVMGAAGSGSGLGLAIVKEVAETAGGRVGARRPSTGGLAVEIRLPTAPDREAPAEAPEPAPADLSAR